MRFTSRDGTTYEWQGALTETTPITVTAPMREPGTVPFSRLIAMTNGAIFDTFDAAGVLS